MLPGILRCLVRPHEPDRRRVKKVGEDLYYGYCTHCGARIRRVKRDAWVRASDWPDAVAD